MKLIDTVESKVDKVIKYVFRLRNEEGPIVEFSYIDNGTGKDIICVSCQTMCNMGCTFCHCTDYIGEIKVFSLSEFEIATGVSMIVQKLPIRQKTLLVSYMGCGEPFNMMFENTIITSMKMIVNTCKSRYETVRFGLATCLPTKKIDRFMKFCFEVKENKLPVKLHLSLHHTNNNTRKECMPNSLDIASSLAACGFYKEYTGNNVEVHYTLIDGVNDSDEDIDGLSEILQRYGFNLKLITYNEKDTVDYKRSVDRKYERFKIYVRGQTEIYTPPGRDVGSSCGQFLFETYEKYALPKE